MHNTITIRHPEAATERVAEELKQGVQFLQTFKSRFVTVFGHRLETTRSIHGRMCKKLVEACADKKFGVITAGHKGIMHIANTTAARRGVPSLRITSGIEYANHNTLEGISTLSYQYLFVRRVIQSVRSKALFFFPGRHGELTELTEHLNLMHMGIIPEKPIVLIDEHYWKSFFDEIHESASIGSFFRKGKQDLRNVFYASDPQEALTHIM